MTFKDIKVGDTVTRMLSGTIPMQLKVVAVDENYIYLWTNEKTPELNDCWKMLRSNGCEVDERFGWDGIKLTGSFIKIFDI